MCNILWPDNKYKIYWIECYAGQIGKYYKCVLGALHAMHRTARGDLKVQISMCLHVLYKAPKTDTQKNKKMTINNKMFSIKMCMLVQRSIPFYSVVTLVKYSDRTFRHLQLEKKC